MGTNGFPPTDLMEVRVVPNQNTVVRLFVTEGTGKLIERAQHDEQTYPGAVGCLLRGALQWIHSGGIHTSCESRLIMLLLVLASNSKEIVETGFDCGHTTAALAMSGAHVVGIDNNSEDPWTKAVAQQSAASVQGRNIDLYEGDALEYLRGLEDNSIDMLFIDDDHSPEHVLGECKEAQRVVREDGFIIFHDTQFSHQNDSKSSYKPVWGLVNEFFAQWQRIDLPARSPSTGEECGLGIIRKRLLDGNPTKATVEGTT